MSSNKQTGGLPVLVLKEGSRRTRGKDAQKTNISAAMIIAESVRSALGPKGMDKMLVDSFGDVTITSDGRTILDEMDVENPAAKMLVEVAKTQDNEAGDGTTSAVVIAGELLGKAQELMEKNIHPTSINDGYAIAQKKALETLENIAISINVEDKKYLKNTAITSMASKLIAEHKEYIAEILVKAMFLVAQKEGSRYAVDIDDVHIEKKTGESIKETALVQGIVLDKEIVHSGMPKQIEDVKIALLDASLEIDKGEFDTKINIESPDQIEAFLKQEEIMLKTMVNKIADSGANLVICQKGIDDLVQHFLAHKGIAAIRRAKKSDIERLAKATGAKIVTNIEGLASDDLGFAELVEERKISGDKMTFIEGCKNPKAVTILIRGSSPRLNSETERSIHDALCVIRDLMHEPKVLAGGGAPELEVAKILKQYAETHEGREQLAVKAYAEALESIAVILSENAGLDPIDILSELRSRHDKGEKWAGIEVLSGKIQDMSVVGIFEPLTVKQQMIKSASEAAMLILRIDDVIASEKMKSPPMPPGGAGAYPGMGGMGAY